MRWPNAKPPRPPRESAKGIDLWGLGLASGCGLGDWILWPGEWGYAIGGLPVDRLTLAHHRRWPAWRAGLRARAGLLDAGGAAKSNQRRRVQPLRRFPPCPPRLASSTPAPLAPPVGRRLARPTLDRPPAHEAPFIGRRAPALSSHPGGMKGEGKGWWREGARGREAAGKNLGRWFVPPPLSLGFAESDIIPRSRPDRRFMGPSARPDAGRDRTSSAPQWRPRPAN
jgi:hypothetical protein